MAVFQDGYNLTGVEKPSGESSAYGAQNANVKLSVETNNVISGTTEIPKNMLSVMNDGKTEWMLEEGTDYSVVYYASEDATEPLASAPATKGDYWVKFVGNNKTAWGETGRYKLTLSESKTALADGDVTLTTPEGGYTYDGTAKEPAVAVVHDGTTLTANTDYTVAYSGNVDAGTASVAVTGIGAYTGTVTKTFDIAKADAATAGYQLAFANNAGPAFEYCGTDVKPAVTVAKGYTPLPASEYSVAYSGDIVNCTAVATADKPKVTVTMAEDSNYTGTQTLDYTISQANITTSATTERLFTGNTSQGNITFTPANGQNLGSSVFTGSALAPELPLRYVAFVPYSSPGQVNRELTSDDIDVSWTDNVNAGTATATVTGKGNFTGTISVNWTIEPKSLADGDVVVSGLDDQAWTGSAVTPPEPVVKVGDRTLVKDTDYDVTYGTNLTDVGTVAVTITGKGNYTDTPAGKFFRIGKTLANAEVTVVDADKQVYTGSPLKPAVTVKVGEDTLKADEDYTVSYSNNTNAGTATVTIGGADAFTGTVTKEFTIARAEVAKPVAKAGLKYTGKPQAGVASAPGAGYAVSGATSATDAGSYSATATLDANHAWAGGSTAALTLGWSIAKAENPLAVKAAGKTLKAKALKKKAQSFAPSLVKKKGQGKLSYAKGKVSKKSGRFSVNKKTGKITVKKGTPKGTYTVQVKVTAAGNANYEASAAKVAKVKVKVK